MKGARAWAKGAWRATSSGALAVGRAWREIADHLAALGGWALVTWGLARLLVPEVWLISGGLFLLAAVGFGRLRFVATEGLYVLSRVKPGRR